MLTSLVASVYEKDVDIVGSFSNLQGLLTNTVTPVNSLLSMMNDETREIGCHTL